jgi:hypothetical protein
MNMETAIRAQIAGEIYTQWQNNERFWMKIVMLRFVN